PPPRLVAHPSRPPPPVRALGGAVPAGAHRAVAPRADVRCGAWQARPREPVGTVGAVPDLAELVDDLTVDVELGDEGGHPPPDDHVAVGQVLCIAHGEAVPVTRPECPDQLRGPAPLVDPEGHGRGSRPGALLPAGAVVDGQRAVRLPPQVVLPGEGPALRDLDVAALAAEAPDHLAASPVDLVPRPGVACRDQQVAVVVLRHG